MKKVLFLYSELAMYFIACARELSKTAKVHIVHWPINKEAPFDFSQYPEIKLYQKAEYSNLDSLIQLVKKIDPAIIISSGWMDKDYVKVNKHFFGEIPTVLSLDNHWTGSLKQRLASLVSRFYFKKIFSDAWVPGTPQAEYAKKLGYDSSSIYRGFYSCDLEYFQSLYENNREQKEEAYARRILYVGRYVKHKGILDLWNAFIKLVEKEEFKDWELWCLGTGDLFDSRVKHSNIKHFGFVQPNDILDHIKETSIFVLPSYFEPWGVVVHEFAAAGFPMIASERVGAANQFITENENGFIYSPDVENDLLKSLEKMMLLTQEQYNAMSQYSNKKSNVISPKKWVDTISSIIKKHCNNA